MRACAALLLLFLLQGIAQAAVSEAPGAKEEIASLKSMKGVAAAQTLEADEMRPKAIREAALTVAVQTAVKHRYEEINQALEAMGSELDRIFNFGPHLMYGGKVLPPIITEARQAFRIEGAETASSSAATFQILEDARMVSTPPSWRSYLIKSFSAAEKVNPALLPRSSDERKIWEQSIDEGWKLGLRQAEAVYEENLARLKRDLLGVILFGRLNAQGVVSLPIMAEGNYGVQVDGKTLSVDQKYFRITQSSQFQGVDKWQPIVTAK